MSYFWIERACLFLYSTGHLFRIVSIIIIIQPHTHTDIHNTDKNQATVEEVDMFHRTKKNDDTILFSPWEALSIYTLTQDEMVGTGKETRDGTYGNGDIRIFQQCETQ